MSADYNVRVHRFRFGDWRPSAIKSLASDPFSGKVAVGREDGDVEICDSHYKWYTQAKLPGKKDFQLQSITWSTQKEEAGRLFGISLRGFIYELDIASLSIKNIRDSYGGSAWCLASSARDASLAVGCVDSAVRIFSYDGGELEFLRGLQPTGARILCVAFHPKEPRLLMGCADGTIRCVDEKTGNSIFRMTGDIYRGMTTYIWSMKVLTDSTVITGDGRGNVQLWDGNAGVLMLNIHQHTAEILSIAVSSDESQVFTSGVDGRVVCIRKVGAASAINKDYTIMEYDSPSDSQWVYTSSHGPHSHDVYSLAICRRNGEDILISGGLDSKICEYSVSEFQKVRPSWIRPVPARGLIQHSDDYRLVVMRHRHRVDIWKIDILDTNEFYEYPKKNKKNKKSKIEKIEDIVSSNNNNSVINGDENCQLCLRMEIKGQDNVHCSMLSPDGRHLAVSSYSGTRLWSIEENSNGSLDVCPITLPSQARGFCHALVFSSDGKRLAVFTSKGLLLLMELISKESVKLKNTENNSNGDSVINEDSVADSDDDIGSEEAEDEEEFLNQGDYDSDGEENFSSDDEDEDNNISSDEEEENNENKSNTEVKLIHVFDHHNHVFESMKNKKGSDFVKGKRFGLSHVGSNLVISSDGQFLAVTDANRGIYVYEVDLLRMHWRLPDMLVPITDVSFHPECPTSLVVVLSNNTFMIYDVELLTLSPWSEENTDKIPAVLKNTPGPLEGVAFNPSSDMSMFLYGQGFCVNVDIGQLVPKVPKTITSNVLSNASFGSKRKDKKKPVSKRRRGESLDPNFAIINKYRGIIHVGFMNDNQIVVIENPWVRILEQLPDTLQKKRYGT
jgi:U3 small nucleolar RNA-associated protein 4